jgi:hypothetical protein
LFHKSRPHFEKAQAAAKFQYQIEFKIMNLIYAENRKKILQIILFKIQFFVKYHEKAKMNPIIKQTISKTVCDPKYGILTEIKFI